MSTQVHLGSRQAMQKMVFVSDLLLLVILRITVILKADRGASRYRFLLVFGYSELCKFSGLILAVCLHVESRNHLLFSFFGSLLLENSHETGEV